jgi:hypothetical protein
MYPPQNCRLWISEQSEKQSGTSKILGPLKATTRHKRDQPQSILIGYQRIKQRSTHYRHRVLSAHGLDQLHKLTLFAAMIAGPFANEKPTLARSVFMLLFPCCQFVGRRAVTRIRRSFWGGTYTPAALGRETRTAGHSPSLRSTLAESAYYGVGVQNVFGQVHLDVSASLFGTNLRSDG